ncbi:MAG: hypothetical protein AB7P03_24695 [Kofleriaceae bacterium]
MYRYGDGTPFPLEENFIETLTTAVESCTNAFVPLTELDARRARAKEGRRDGEIELSRLTELEKALAAALNLYMGADKKGAVVGTAAQKLSTTVKQTITEAQRQVEARVQQLDAQALARTASDAVIRALSPFFQKHQLPKTEWIMSWDVRGAMPHSDAIASSGRIAAAFTLDPEPYRSPIRVDQLADGVIVHMMKKGVFGKPKPAPIDLGKYAVVSFERTGSTVTVTLKESAHKPSGGLRFAVSERGATWVAISTSGDAEGDPEDLDVDDVAPVRLLTERANATLGKLLEQRQLIDLTLGGQPISELEEPRIIPLDLLAQLTPLARTIREKSRMSGELVLKRDVVDGRREELFVPRATLAQQFARLPMEYRKPFEEMGISAEDTQPAIMLPRPPAPPPPPPKAFAADEKTVENEKKS